MLDSVNLLASGPAGTPSVTSAAAASPSHGLSDHHRVGRGLSLRAPARGFADDLALVARSEADMTCLLQVVAHFCECSGMQVDITKSVATAFVFATGSDLSTEGIQYKCLSLPGLAAEEA